MFNGLFDATTVPVLEQVVTFAQDRHQVLSGNIANIDTPGYRTRDLPPELFEASLRRALDRRDRTEGANLAGYQRPSDPFSDVRNDVKNMVRHDESNVGFETQITEVAKNQMTHNLAMTVLNNQLQLLGAAISERA
ncbi:MAG TPA: flagellar basal body protein [Pirellulales bacterium]|jgi:flagellar basal-body rod protein FlgB|nr:flagellar basal body protein [Pirellulales bacterium]